MRENMRWLWKYIKQLKGLYVLCMIVALLDLLTSLGMTGMQKWLIDDVFHKGNYDLLTPLLLVFAGLVVLYNGVHLLYFHLRQKNTFLFREKVSDDMMQYFYSIPVKRYQNERTGHFVNYLTNDVSNASTTLASFLPDGIMNVFRVLILVTIVGIASPVILIATTVLCLGYIFLGKYFGHRFKKLGKDVQQARGEVTVQIEEGISSTREVVAYHRMKWEKEKYDKSFNRYFDLVMADGKLKNKELALLEPFRWAITVIAFGCVKDKRRSLLLTGCPPWKMRTGFTS